MIEGYKEEKTAHGIELVKIEEPLQKQNDLAHLQSIRYKMHLNCLHLFGILSGIIIIFVFYLLQLGIYVTSFEATIIEIALVSCIFSMKLAAYNMANALHEINLRLVTIGKDLLERVPKEEKKNE